MTDAIGGNGVSTQPGRPGEAAGFLDALLGAVGDPVGALSDGDSYVILLYTPGQDGEGAAVVPAAAPA